MQSGVAFRRMPWQNARCQQRRDEQTRAEHGERQEVTAHRVEGATDHRADNQTESEEGFQRGLFVVKFK